MLGRASGLCVLCLAAIGVSGRPDLCGRQSKAPGLTFGRTESGYWVRTDLIPGALPPGVSKRGVALPGDYLASEVGATPMYVAGQTTTSLGQGEWRGPDPLTAFRAFCNAGGLEVDTSVPGLWVVVERGDPVRAAVTVFAQEISDAHRRPFSAGQVAAIDRALVWRLTERYCQAGDQAIGVSYYWLPAEGPDTLLAVASWLSEGNFATLQSTVFKVRVEQSGRSVDVDCVWRSSESPGVLMADVDADFDGDGYRDFLFDPGTVDGQNAVIISGKSGAKLLEFRQGLLAVEKRSTGPATIAAATKEGGRWANRVLRFDNEQSEFVPSVNVEAQAAGGGGTTAEGLRRQLVETLAATVGGRRNVILLAAPGWRPELTAGDQGSDRLTFIDWVPSVLRSWYYLTPQQVANGRPARILYRWESPAYQAERTKRAREHERQQR